jgi:hypothetical protein
MLLIAPIHYALFALGRSKCISHGVVYIRLHVVSFGKKGAGFTSAS